MSIKISGLEAIQRKFEALPKKVQRKVMREGVTQAAKIVRAQARADVPVATGDLRKSIKVRGLQAAKGAAFLNKTKGGSRSVKIGKTVVAEAPHAHLVEKGTKRMRAQPFLLPALQANEQRTVDLVGDSVRNAVKEA